VGAEVAYQVAIIYATEGFGEMASTAAANRLASISTVTRFEAISTLAAGREAGMAWEASQAARASQTTFRVMGSTMTGSTGAGQSVIMNIGTAGNVTVGGAYRDIEAAGGEVHHMPAASVSTLSRNAGPAIRMDIADHRLTASH